MVGDTWSQTSSLISNERQPVLQLLLTTLSEEIQVVIDLQEFDRLDEFETAVLEQLPTIGSLGASWPLSIKILEKCWRTPSGIL